MATALGAYQAQILKHLAKEQSRFLLLERYYDGDAPLPEGAENASKAYRRFQRKSRLNLAQLSVSAVRERMRVAGFRTSAANDENGDDVARRIWKVNHLDVLSSDLHTSMLKFGEAYAIVGFPNGREYPLITVEDPRQVHAVTNAEDPSQVDAALKVFSENGTHFAFFYFPDRIEVYSKKADESIFSADKWEWVSTDVNPLGVVPVVKFRNADGRGEYEQHLDLLDRINHMILQRLVIATSAAFKQKWISGDFPTHDADGNEVDYNGLFESAPGAMWMLPEGAQLGQLDQSQMQDILSAVRADVQDFAAVTATPMYYFSGDSTNQSAEGASLSREGLVFKTENRIARATVGWTQVMALAFKWLGDEERANMLDLEPLWKPVDRSSLAERADAWSKFADIPFRSKAKLIGQFSPAEVAEMEVEKASDAVFTAALVSTPPVETATATVPQETVRDKAEALGTLVRAGVIPGDAARIVGLDSGLTFIDAMPITLKPTPLLDAETAATQAKA